MTLSIGPPLTMTSIHCHRLALLAAALLAASGRVAHAQPDVTLGDAVALALAKNHDISIERENVEQADAGIERARAAFDPVLRLEGSYRDQRLPVTTILSGAPEGELAPTFREAASRASYSQLLASGASVTFASSVARDTSNSFLTLISPAWFTTFGAEIRQPLFQNRRIDPARRAVKIAIVSRDRSQASLRRSIVETVAAVEQAYWMLVAAGQDVEIRRSNVELAERQRQDVAARIEGKVTPEADIAQPDAEIARRRGELLAAIESRTRAEHALKRLMFDSATDPGWDAALRTIDVPAAPEARVDVREAVATAIAQRPELGDADARIALQEIELEAARDRVRPQLDLVGAFTARGLAGAEHEGVIRPFPGLPVRFPDDVQGGLGSSLENAFLHRFPDASVGVQLTIPIGHRAARAEVAIGESVKRQVRSAREQLLLHIGVEVRNAVTAVDTARERIEVARASREAAEVQLQAEQDRYSAGLGTTFLVLTRQNDLSAARLAEATAHAAHRRALVELSRARGTLLAERRIEVTAARQ